MPIRREVNFADGKRQPVMLVTASLWLAVFALLAAIAWTMGESNALRFENAQLEKHISRLHTELAAQQADMVSAPDISQTKSQMARIAYFNTLSGQRSPPVMSVLVKLESIVPEQVRLSKLAYDVELGSLSISLQSPQDSSLPDVLRQIETAFASVILERQLRLQQAGRPLLQFDVEAVVK